MTNPTEPGASSVSEYAEQAWQLLASATGLNPDNWHAARNRLYDEVEVNRDCALEAIKAALALTTPARSSGEMGDDEVIAAFAFLYRQYGLEDDAKLTEDAIALKRKVLAALTPNANEAAVAGDGLREAALRIVTLERARHGLGPCAWSDLLAVDQDHYERLARAALFNQHGDK